MGGEMMRDAKLQTGTKSMLDAASRLSADSNVPADFVPTLFAHTAAEDLAALSPELISEISAKTYAFLQDRDPGAPKIRVRTLKPQSGRRVTIIDLINDDRPFLFDSVMNELTERGHGVRLVAHPILAVRREAGRLHAFGEAASSGDSTRESLIHIHIDPLPGERDADVLATALGDVLQEVALCTDDWRAMTGRVEALVDAMRTAPSPLPQAETAEAVEFLQWLLDNNFTFLGVRDYVFQADGGVGPQFATGLGILRKPEVRVLRRGAELVAITPEIAAFLEEPKALIITKANVRARVHRRAHMDYIGVKRFDRDGRVLGEVRIVGLFTSEAYTRSVRTIPYLRRKFEIVLARAGLHPQSHSGKALVNVLEHYPRDELFQIDEETLGTFALAIMQLEERPRVRVLARRDRFDRFVSVLVFVPRDRYDSSARIAIGEYLAAIYRGRVSAFFPFFPEGPLVRVHFIIGRYEGETPDPSRESLETAVRALVRTWADALEEALAEAFPHEEARRLFQHYGAAFSLGYREAYPPTTAVADIRVMETLEDAAPLAARFTVAAERAQQIQLKIWSRNVPVTLSTRVPILENMGFRVVDERTYQLDATADGVPETWLHDMTLEPLADGASAEPFQMQALEACFTAVVSGAAENDGFNALVLAAQLDWRDVSLVRALGRFLRQARIPYSQDYIWTTLIRHAAIARQLVALFRARFDPSSADAASAEAAVAEIETGLAAVESLDEDQILRRLVETVRAALRTNYFQRNGDGNAKAAIAIKFASRSLTFLPAPRPLYEVFVYSPRVEGVHLRFGKVARGGLRWSDRPQDFRTEVLGLVKAQQVKNAVIVPVGAKGGFVPKQIPAGASREAVQAEGIATYKLFVGSLLDITDNLGPDGVIPPQDVVRHDGDDPYLVVAADKGTATFSDIANALSTERMFWLGDAFASGGSAGYDHKGMGITARGGWEAVKRHFREMDVDIRLTPFTVAGVGDMSGDVFGNAMLRERTIKLVAAFDHRDILIDPKPDPERSFAERERLFRLPRSSWKDYDPTLLSAGGGVWSRSLKEIALSPEARAALAIDKERVSPAELMGAILRAPVDLLWFGGIGTYVRASSESNEAVGDRGNDMIRATGAELRCKVIGEGANLGMTQRGRVEAAQRGVRLNTDAIDNSAGVNTSDVEVNIKIALSAPVREGTLSGDVRNAVLAEMTDEVAALVLRNNYLQTLALSLAERRALSDFGFQHRLLQTLEGRGLLDRTVEALPDELELAERRARSLGFARPELAVLLAYAKIALYDELLQSSVPDDSYLGRELNRYFPQPLSQRFPEAVQAHRLRREIIATQLSNSMINRGGPALIVRMADQTGASAAAIAAAFAIVRDSYGMPELNTEIDALDGRISGQLQLELYAEVQDLLHDRLVWFLRNVDVGGGLAAAIEHYREGIEALGTTIPALLSPEAQATHARRLSDLTSAGVPLVLSQRIASLPTLAAAPDLVLVADQAKRPMADVAATYFAAAAFFRLDRIAADARGIPIADYFDRLALDRSLDTIARARRALTTQMVGGGMAGTAAVEAWRTPRAEQVERIRGAVDEIARSGLTLSKLSVAASLIADLLGPHG